MVVPSDAGNGDDHSVVKTAEVKRATRFPREGKRLAKVTTAFVKRLTAGTVMYIHRQRFRIFTLVGIVEHFEDKKTEGYEFRLSDSEGEVLVRYYWPQKEAADKTGDNTEPKPVVKNGSLVRVFGSFISSSRSSESFVSALKVIPLTDLNELTMHNLEVVDMMITLKKIKENILANRSPTTGFMSLTVERKEVQNHRSDGAPQGKDNKTMVWDTISVNTEATGMSIADLQKSLPNISPAELRVILDILLGEGNIFTTVDDTRFKSTKH